MKFAYRLFILVFAVLLVNACGPFSARLVFPQFSNHSGPVDIKSEVDELAEPLIDSGESAGLAVGVLTPDGQLSTFGYGTSGIEDGAAKPQSDTIFQIGSLSKLFVSTLLVALVDEGVLQYSDTVRSILPADVVLTPQAGNITLYQLVTHTSGLPREPHSLSQVKHFLAFLFTGANLYSYITKDSLYQYLARFDPPPLQHDYVYSNLGAGLLAHLMEVKTGQTLPDLIDTRICRPLNLQDTGFILSQQQQRRLAVGHPGDQPLFMSRRSPLMPWDMGEIMRGAGGMYSTTTDLLKLAKANLGLLHHPVAAAFASTQHVQFSRPQEDVAIGWLVNHFPERRQSILYVHGMVAGYSAYLGMNPEKKIAVAVLSNNFNWKDKIGHNLVLRLSEKTAESHIQMKASRY